uniref:hypothetical protein n=1 Tax=Thiolapillus sp. TaxID=2017437 RepID=UPI003AF486CD
SQNLHPNNSPDLFKSDTGDDRLPQNPVGGGVGKYDKVEISNRGNIIPRVTFSMIRSRIITAVLKVRY